MDRPTRLIVLFWIVNAIVSTSLVTTAKAAVSNTPFDWQKISPSPKLNWVECFTNRQCARLEVPLDYSDPAGDKAAVALLRVKANVSSDSKEYRGPVLLNPGGPGGSGVLFVDQVGDTVQQALGNEYDIIGFDPRGVGQTTPVVSIFPDAIEQAYWNAGAPPLLNSTAAALPQAFFRAHLFSGLVEARSKVAAEHVSTTVVARDMLSITKAHGRDRLQYWGFSYGTVIGATYAAMFPDNVERLIIDGVVDPDDYYSGDWLKSLFDTDKVLQFFYDKCASAGAACPLHADTAALVQQRVESILASVKENPVPAINGTEYGLIDFTFVKTTLFQSLYTPFSSFPPLAQALAALESGDALPALEGFRSANPLPKCDAPPLAVPLTQEASLAIGCGDSQALGINITIAETMAHFEMISKDSVFADIWTDMTHTSCAGWNVLPAERFAGSFAVNTSFPLLVIGNTMDPVTPLVGAQKMASTFGSAALLTINTPGHTSSAATSLCATKVITDYFRLGKLPANGTVCQIEDVLFGTNVTASPNMTAGDAGLLEAARLLSRDIHASRGSRFL